MSEGRLIALAAQLRDAGIDPGHIGELQDELDAVQDGQGFFARWADIAKRKAREQWSHVVEELRESKEVMGILRNRVGRDEPLSDEERDKVKEQLGDIVRAVPAGMIATVNAVQPIPGTTMLTPWLLLKLGMLPSRWREAHVLAELHKEEERLRAAGHTDAADQLHSLEETLEHEADKRETAAHEADLLARWDANGNGVWDDDEIAAYRAEVDKLKTLAVKYGANKRWFLCGSGQVFGPLRLTALRDLAAVENLLLCFDGQSGWVELGEVV